MFCRLETLPVATPCVSIIVVAEHDLSALRRTLASIALQSVMPLDVTLAMQADDAEAGRRMAMAMLPSGLATAVAVHDRDADSWASIPRLIDGRAGAAFAVIAGGDLLAPDFLATALARFGASGGESIAAVAVRDGVGAESSGDEMDDDELPLGDILRQAEPRAACFVYRREAVERVGGWSADLPATAARWDLHLRLAVEWKIGLLPARLATRAAVASAPDQSGVAAFRSMQLRQLLRRSPDQLGLLLLLAQESVSSREGEAALHVRIDQLSRQVDNLALILARQAAWRDLAPARMYEGSRTLRKGTDLPHAGARAGGDSRMPPAVEDGGGDVSGITDPSRAADARDLR